MNQSSYEYGRVGKARELSGRDRTIYRLLEMLPGVLSWGTIIVAVILSRWWPLYAAIFIIAFDVYWFVKTVFLTLHMRRNKRRMDQSIATDWNELLRNIPDKGLRHLVLLPYYKESYETVSRSLDAIKNANTDLSRLIIVLAAEERAGAAALEVGERARREYGSVFGHFLITVHPTNVPGEMPGKGSNISYAAEQVRRLILDPEHIAYDSVVVSAFDIDTVVYGDYFSCLAWHVLTHSRPLHASFQPVPLYTNNIWDAPAISRVVAFSGTFWQMIQQERPERLATFSSHALMFDTLWRVGYWQKNMVSEDSRIYWNCFVFFDGDYEVVPMSHPVAMDANLASTWFATMKNVYLQQRRWSWGVENVPYILFNFIKNKKISFRTKVRIASNQLEGFWSLATNPILIFLLGWLPIWIGIGSFHTTVLAYNLPTITRDIMLITMLGLMVSAYMALVLLPDRPRGVSRWSVIPMLIQWILVPVTIIIFGAIPALDAQFRLIIGRYLGFWVTPKQAIVKGVKS